MSEGEELQPVVEEEALLAQVQARIAELAGRAATGQGADRLRELRDEAASARPDDLPALLDQLHTVRSLGERRRAGPLPERASPYFAHLRLRDGEGARDYLLGHVALLDAATGLRIIDWRHAPLARIFYRYREGDAYDEELPGRRVEGTVELRRILVIVEGRLQAVHLADGVLERGAGGWRRRGREELPELGGGAGKAERGHLGTGAGGPTRGARPDVSALLDKVQYEIVHAYGRDPLLVLGSAGSGKTTVALHRLAALHHDSPEGFGARRLQVVVPEPGLARLSRRLLSPLGLGGVDVATFTAWARREVVRLLPELPRRSLDDAPTAVARLKRHRGLLAALPGWLAARGAGPDVFAGRRTEAAGPKPSIERLRQELLTDRAILGRVVEGAQGELPPFAIEETVQRTLRQGSLTAEGQYRGVDPERLAALDGRGLDEGTPDDVAGTLDEEDDPILLELWRLTRGAGVRTVAHLVLDEAQELRPFELAALRQALGGPERASATVAGDDVQRTAEGPGFPGWDGLLESLGIPDAPRRTLTVGYRCPRPIARVARAILGRLAGPEAEGAQPGVPVAWHRFQNGGAATLFLQDAIADLLAREPAASLAILTRSAPGAVRWAADLDQLTPVRLVRDGDFSFDPGVDVCEIIEAKGLEFDYVLVPDADAARYPDDDESRRLLHVAATRAMHQLWFCSVGTPSRLLPWGFG